MYHKYQFPYATCIPNVNSICYVPLPPPLIHAYIPCTISVMLTGTPGKNGLYFGQNFYVYINWFLTETWFLMRSCTVEEKFVTER